MRNIIAGTAGHIDHGKSALVRALTGIEPDRWEEERRRGISIDLGFAHMQADKDVRIGFIDVPGHERFVRNMLAGVGGIDLVLLVVGADESIKPQTREHFDICRLLGIRHGMVVLTKADLVDPELVDLVKLEVEEFVAGSFLEGAPMVAVSSKTGLGLDQLRTELARLARGIAEKDADGLPRLPIDRSFVMRGFGTVVTGTLVSGRVAVDQEVEVQPGGRRLRVRGVQVHGASAKSARAGQRTALNVVGAEAAELGRGAVLVLPGSLAAQQLLDCEIRLLASATPLKHRAPVHFHAWTAETEAQVRLLDREVLEPGGAGPARLVLRQPVALLPGDRFILRMFSPVVTIGGGRVVDIDPPRRLRRAAVASRIGTLADAPPAERLSILVAESAFGAAVSGLVGRLGVAGAEIGVIAKQAGLVVLDGADPWLVDATRFRAFGQKVHDVVGAFHRSNPLLPGIAKEEVRTSHLAGAPPFVFDAVVRGSRTVVAEGELLRLGSHRLQLQQDEEQALGKIAEAFESAGLAVPSVAEVLARCGVDPARSRSLLQILLRQRKLVRINDDLVFHQSAITALRDLLAQRRGSRFSVPEFKDWTGVSRKYAIPLLEFLDKERITRRDGEQRLVL
jgi:selenocysteine-specific elongation factor